MTETNGSGLANLTSHTCLSPLRCSGPGPSKTVAIPTYLVLMTFSLTGNLLIVAVFYRNRSLRTAVHYFIVNMAISDLMIPVIHLPWWMSCPYLDGLWLVDGVIGTVLCKLVWNTLSLSTVVSVVNMLVIAVDRFRAVLFPMKSALLSQNKRRLIIAATWLFSVALHGHIFYATKVVPRDTGPYCTFQWEPESHMQKVLQINLLAAVSLISVSAIVLTILYSSIIFSLHRRIKHLHLANEIIKKRESKNRKIAYMLVTIVVVFYIVWIPYAIAHNIWLSCFTLWLALMFPLLYPLVNPLVYYIFNEEYRQGFRELLCCPWPCANKCKECFQPSVSPQRENNAHNAEQVNNVMENIELQEQ